MANKKLLLAISFNYHDSSVAFAIDDEILLVLEAERIFREKKKKCNSEEMEYLIKYGLELLNKSIDDVSYCSMTTLCNPWLEEEDKKAKPPFWKEICFLGMKRRTFIVNHHISHAAAFFYSGMNNAIVLTCDGGGDFGERVTIYTGKGNELRKEEANPEGFITAKPYDLCSTYIYNGPMCEGKFMALSAFGKPREEYVSKFEDLLPTLCTTDYKTGNRILSEKFPGLKGRASASNKDASDLCASVQESFVRHRMKDINDTIARYSNKNLMLCGGACLNLEINTKVWDEKKDINMFIPSCCDDTGVSLGAIAYLIVEIFGKRPKVKLPYLGYGNPDYEYLKTTLDELVDNLLDDYVILMHNGKAEIGPRALGNRSFIARPDKKSIKETLSVKIKSREEYRPLAPVVLEEKISEYYIGPKSSRFMLDQYNVRKHSREKVIGGIHIDGTARAQTLTKESNPFFYDLIKKFGDRTETYVLLNTSLNLRGVPISNRIEETLEISGKLDYKHRVVHNGELIK